MLDDQDIVPLLRAEVARAGGQSSWARRERIDRTLLNRVLHGRRPPTEQIIRALKLCNVYCRNDRPQSVCSRRSKTNVQSTT
jgi:DNA-binding phage protein